MLAIPVGKIKNVSGKHMLLEADGFPEDILAPGILIDKLLAFKGEARNFGAYIKISGNITGKLRLSCDLCGDEFPYKLDIPFQACYRQGNELPDMEGEDDLHAFTGSTIDIEPEVLSDILFSLPMKIVCKPDCAGLCQYCGAMLNFQSCNCTSESTDHRWARLKEFKFD